MFRSFIIVNYVSTCICITVIQQYFKSSKCWGKFFVFIDCLKLCVILENVVLVGLVSWLTNNLWHNISRGLSNAKF